MGESQFNKPMKFNEWWAIRSQALQELRLTPEEWYRLFAGTNIDTGGTPQVMLNTAGAITEASAASIATNTQYTIYAMTAAGNQFKPFTILDTSTKVVNGMPKRLSVTLTATAGGEIVAAPLVAAGAGYLPCLVITSFWSDQTDGSIALTFAPSGGAFTKGPSAVTIATTANTVTPIWYDGIGWKGNTANTAINVAAAAGQCGANQVIIVNGYYWYEIS